MTTDDQILSDPKGSATAAATELLTLFADFESTDNTIAYAQAATGIILYSQLERIIAALQRPAPPPIEEDPKFAAIMAEPDEPNEPRTTPGTLDQSRQLHSDASLTFTHLPGLFHYATKRADSASQSFNTHSFRKWEIVRNTTASLIAALNDTDLRDDHHNDPKPTPPEITFVSPREKLTEVLHDFIFLPTILNTLVSNARTQETRQLWLDTRHAAYVFQTRLAHALTAETTDDH